MKRPCPDGILGCEDGRCADAHGRLPKSTGRSRECKGCGGSGAAGKQLAHSLSRFVEFEDGSLSYVPGEPYMATTACPACLGTGRVTDGPYRRDAEVDAAQTWGMAHEVHDDAINFCWLLLNARESGHSVKGHMAYALASHATDVPQEIAWAASEARNAARAAFRAVPGLREE